nr:serum response factor-like isoform X3 [Paramormyrops kingsleyae]
MLPSQAGSAPAGNGSASGRDNASHDSGFRPGSVRRGLIEVATVAARSADGSRMLGGNGAGVGSRMGVRQGNGAGLTALQSVASVGGLGAPGGGRYEPDREIASQTCSGSDADSDLGDDDDPMSSRRAVRRGVKRERPEMEGAAAGAEIGMSSGGYAGVPGGVAGAKPGKKTRGRVKIEMAFIDNKLRRYTTFSKRKTGIMKKAYELSTLTGTQVLLLVASETGHVYTFATRKLQPMITSETGKALIQTCLNSPDSPPRSDPSSDQRMSATGFEETDLTYQVSESDSCGESKDPQKPTFTVASLPSAASTTSTSASLQAGGGGGGSPSFPITTCWPISMGASTNSVASANGTVLKASGTSGGVMQLSSGFTLMSSGGVPQPLQAIQVHPSAQQNSVATSESSPEMSQANSSSSVSLPAAIVTSSVPTSVSGHVMYHSPPTVMYTSTPTLADGSGLAVLNAFSQAPPSMQVSHAQAQDTGALPQVFLTAPTGAVQIPVSAVQLHPLARCWSQDLLCQSHPEASDPKTTDALQGRLSAEGGHHRVQSSSI